MSKTDRANPDYQIALRWRTNRQVAAWRLRLARVDAGLTQRELAARSGLTNDAISALERGRRVPRPATLRTLADALGITPASLVVPLEPDPLADPTSSPFGELGRLSFDPERGLRCHVCGRFYANLGRHAVEAHGFTAAAYRERFGLKATTSLMTPALRDRFRVSSAARVGTPAFTALQDAARSRRESITPDQRSAWTRGRQIRLEERLDPHRQATNLANLAKAQATRVTRLAASPPAQPARVRGEPLVQTCTVCGGTFTDPDRKHRLTCGPDCVRELRRRKAVAWKDTCRVWGAALRSRRTAAGLTVAALADRVGVSASMIYQLELGYNPPSAAVHARLAATLAELPPRPLRPDTRTAEVPGKRTASRNR